MSSSTGLRTMTSVLLFSGGLDSFILWHLLGYPTPVYVTLGHKYEQQELATIERLGIDIVRLAGPQVGQLEQADGHIPQRNLLLATTAAAALQPDIIYLGAVRGETSRDKSGRFLGRTSRLLSFCEQPVKVLAPARRWTKTQLVRRYLRRLPDGITYLLATRSCYADS